MERYLMKEGRVTIQDDFLGIDHSSPFALPTLPLNPKNGEEVESGERVAIYNFPDGSKRISLEKDGFYHGEWRLIYPSGALKIQTFYLKGALHGPFLFFQENQKILVESWSFEGMKVGKSRSFYSGGEKSSLEQFVQGVPHGEQFFWYPDGTLKTIMEYDHGLLEGKVELFHPDGSLFRALKCRKGNVVTSDDGE